MPSPTRHTSLTIGERTIHAGDEVRLVGERGRYRFLAYVTSTAGTEWVDLWGPAKGSPGHRSVTIDRLRLLPDDGPKVLPLPADVRADLAAIVKAGAWRPDPAA